jgi:virulence plasmid B protein
MVLIATVFALCFCQLGLSVAQAQYLWNDNPPDEPRSVQPDTDGITSSGAATYSVPIVVPKARGPVPNLAPLYNFQSGNGVAGMGWSISGIPAITRIRGDAGMRFTAGVRFKFSDSYSYLPGGGAHRRARHRILRQSRASRI